MDDGVRGWAQVLVDAPNMVRQSYSLKRLALTDFVVDVPRACKKTTLVKALEEAGKSKYHAKERSQADETDQERTHETRRRTVLTRRTKRCISTCNATDVVNKFKATRWGQKLAAREAKANTSDFDRYKLMVQRMKKSAAMKRELAKLKKQAA